MTEYDQKGQTIDNQYNAGRDINITVVESKVCYICGKPRPLKEVIHCTRCHRIICISHQKSINLPYCPDCYKLVELETELSHPNENIRFSAAQKLCKVNDRQAVPKLVNRMEEEPDPIVRYWLANALGRIGGTKARSALNKAETRETDPFAKRGIVEALQIMSNIKSP